MATITELLGIVVDRVEDVPTYEKLASGLIHRLIEARDRLLAAGLGQVINASNWIKGKEAESNTHSQT